MRNSRISWLMCEFGVTAEQADALTRLPYPHKNEATTQCPPAHQGCKTTTTAEGRGGR